MWSIGNIHILGPNLDLNYAIKRPKYHTNRVFKFKDLSKPNEEDTFFYIRTENQKMAIEHGKNIKMVCLGGEHSGFHPPSALKNSIFSKNVDSFHQNNHIGVTTLCQ